MRMKAMLQNLKKWARKIKDDLVVLYHALRDAAAPCPARIVGGLTVAYALSPIDLIPDFIPVLGMLDDIVLVPAGLWLAWRLLPVDLVARYQAQRAVLVAQLPQSKTAAVVVIVLWLLAVALTVPFFYGGAAPEK
jgi:uncharacterized membrane protein YkvA (DUF1232 family)